MKTLDGILPLLLIGFLVTSTNLCAAATENDGFKVSPTTNNGQKWRIAYYEGGPYIDYRKIFTAFVSGLMKLGWIEAAQLPEQDGETTQPLWQWLSANAQSNYLEFIENGHYSADWANEKRPDIIAQLMPRLKASNDVDLLIAMGTVAGQDFANDRHNTPTLVLSSSDPITSGIIVSAEDSGFDHVHAVVDPRRYERQVRIFHDVAGFQTLGIMYEDTFNGRSYAGVASIEKVAKERNFEIVRCYNIDEQVDDVQARDESVKSCFKKLAEDVDAIYVTANLGLNKRTIPELVKIAHKYRIPTFSQTDSSEVRYGFLLSLSQAELKYVGEFHARVFAKVLNGAKPGQLSQIFEDPIKLALNLKTAETIGFYLGADLLAATDEFYYEIEEPE